MASIFVLNVPEFQPLIDVALARPDLEVRPTTADYTEISSSGELRLNRRELGFKPALWYGSLTAGIRGVIVQFDRDDLKIVDVIDE